MQGCHQVYWARGEGPRTPSRTPDTNLHYVFVKYTLDFIDPNPGPPWPLLSASLPWFKMFWTFSRYIVNSTSNGDLTRRFIFSLFAELLDFAGVFSGVLQLGLPDGQAHVAIIINLSARVKINPMSQNLVPQIGWSLNNRVSNNFNKHKGNFRFWCKNDQQLLQNSLPSGDIFNELLAMRNKINLDIQICYFAGSDIIPSLHFHFSL